jgi:hypothetical protein
VFEFFHIFEPLSSDKFHFRSGSNLKRELILQAENSLLWIKTLISGKNLALCFFFLPVTMENENKAPYFEQSAPVPWLGGSKSHSKLLINLSFTWR